MLALGLIVLVTYAAETEVITALAGTTALLLLCVFAVVNVACVVVRHNDDASGTFTAPSWTPYLGAVACLYLVGPWARDSDDWIQYRIAGILLGIGIVLWVITWLTNRAVRAKHTGFRDIEHLGE